MTELPSNSHKSREAREVTPVTMSTGRVRSTPIGRRLRETFIHGSAKSMWTTMIWETFLPNLGDNIADAIHDGIDSLFGGSGGGRSVRSARRNRFSNSGISKHNPDTVLGNRVSDRYSKEDRQQHNVGMIELDSRAEAEAVLEQMLRYIDQYDVVTLAEFYQMVRMTPEHTDYKWGWEEIGGAKVVPSRGSYYLDLPQPIVLR